MSSIHICSYVAVCTQKSVQMKKLHMLTVRLVFVITVLLLLLPPQSVQSQNRTMVDSMLQEVSVQHDSNVVKTYINLYRVYYSVDLDSAAIFARRALAIGSQSSEAITQARAYNIVGIYHSHTSTYDSAIWYFQVARNHFKEAGDQLWELNAGNNIATMLLEQGDLEGALAEQTNILTRKLDLGMEGEDVASAYWNIGNILLDLDKVGEAKAYYEKSLVIYQQLGYEADVIDLQFQLAGVYEKQGSLSKAKELFLKCAVFAKEHGQQNALAEVYDHLGDIEMVQGSYKEAEDYLLSGLSMALQNGDRKLPGQFYRRLTDLYMITDQLGEAEKYALLSMQNAAEVGRSKKIITDYLNLSEIYERQGKLQLALDYHKQYAIQQDSIFGIEKLNAINDLQLELERAKKQQEIELLKEKEKRSTLQKRGMAVGLVGLALLSGLLVYAMRQRLIKNKLAKEKVDQQLRFSEEELQRKKQELTAYAMQLAHKNELLSGIKNDVQDLSVESSKRKSVQRIVNTIHINQNDDETWEGFRTRFQAVHQDFEVTIKKSYPAVSNNELRLMSLLKMKLSNKEIANILNISNDGIKKARYRLRKKLGMEREESLEDLILSL